MRCSNCGESNEPGARFCFNCGAELSAAAAGGERRSPDPARERPSEQRPPEESAQPVEPEPPVWPPPPEQSDASERPVERSDTFVFPPPPPVAPPPPPGPPEPSLPPQYGSPATLPGTTVPPQYPDWRMGGVEETEPEPPRRRRNRFLMVILGILLGCLLLCVGLFVFSVTPAGQDFFEDVGTSVADMATEASDNT